MAGERIQRYIGQHAQFREALLDFSDGTRYQTFGVGGFDAVWCFQCRINDREQCQHRNAQSNALFGNGHQQVERQPLNPRHGRHGFASVLSIEDKDRVDQVRRGNGVFAHQRTRKRIFAHAPHANGWKLGG